MAWILALYCHSGAAYADPIVGGQPPFSSLSDVDSDNVKGLVLTGQFRTEASGAHAVAPVVAGDILLVLTPFPHTLYALDLSKPNLPVKWRYTPAADRIALGMACCGAPSGGVSAVGERIYFATFDGHVIALDRSTGGVVWDEAVASPGTGENFSSSPLVLGSTVFVGSSGDDLGARGWLSALDAATGAPKWKVFTTGSDKDVGIGSDFHPFYTADQHPDRGMRTWPPDGWKQGGGGLAGALVYDPVSQLLFQATGHPAPWNPDQREGDNRWTSGIFARSAHDGSARWFDAMNSHDPYARGARGGLAIVSDGQSVKLIHPDANGYVYSIDTATGQILSAPPYMPITASNGVDLKTGALKHNSSYLPKPRSTVRDICPAWPAGANPQPAFSPQTSLLYLAVSALCMDMEAVPTGYIAGTAFTGGNVRLKSGAGEQEGEVVAWNIGTQTEAWKVSEVWPVRSSPLATQGSLIFYGTLDGWLKAVDAKTGALLWQFQASSGIVSQPVTYRGPDHRQYVAVLAGSGGFTGTKSSGEIDPRDSTAAKGLGALLGGLPAPVDSSGTLYEFRLP